MVFAASTLPFESFLSLAVSSLMCKFLAVMAVKTGALHMLASALPLSHILSPNSFFKKQNFLHTEYTEEYNPKLAVGLLVHALYRSQRYQKCHGPVRRKSLLGRGTQLS